MPNDRPRRKVELRGSGRRWCGLDDAGRCVSLWPPRITRLRPLNLHEKLVPSDKEEGKLDSKKVLEIQGKMTEVQTKTWGMSTVDVPKYVCSMWPSNQL